MSVGGRGIKNVRARQKEARNVTYTNKITYSFLFFLLFQTLYAR